MASAIGLSGAEVTVPDPTADPTYGDSYDLLAGAQRTLDSTLQVCYATAKRHWRLSWMQLTYAEKETLMTELRRASNLSWMPPTGGTYTVHVQSSPTVEATGLGWSVRAELLEV